MRRALLAGAGVNPAFSLLSMPWQRRCCARGFKGEVTAMRFRSIVLAVALLGLLAGCAAPASGPAPSASPAFGPQPEPAFTAQGECERNGGTWFRETGYCAYEVE
jgi:hypothetical protein